MATDRRNRKAWRPFSGGMASRSPKLTHGDDSQPGITRKKAGRAWAYFDVDGKRITDRARPPLEYAVPPFETSASFPSGHTLNSIVIAGMFCYLLVSHQTTRAARAVTVTLTVLYVLAMGLSRVYLGHHWLTDVLAAWCLGIAWLTVVITCHRLWLTQHQDHSLAPQRSAN